MESLLNLIKEQQWYKIYEEYMPEMIAKQLPFEQGMLLAYQMLFNKQRDDNLREYAVKLLENIRTIYPIEWNSNWKNDSFLGDAYYFTMKLDEYYKAHERASKQVDPLPPPLLVSLAGYYLDQNPTQYNEAEKLLKKALEQEKSIEAVVLMRSLYKEKGDEKQVAYWSKILDDLERKNAYMQKKWPEFLEKQQIN